MYAPAACYPSPHIMQQSSYSFQTVDGSRVTLHWKEISNLLMSLCYLSDDRPIESSLIFVKEIILHATVANQEIQHSAQGVATGLAESDRPSFFPGPKRQRKKSGRRLCCPRRSTLRQILMVVSGWIYGIKHHMLHRVSCLATIRKSVK